MLKEIKTKAETLIIDLSIFLLRYQFYKNEIHSTDIQTILI